MAQVDSAALELALQDRVLVEAATYGRNLTLRAVVVKACDDELWLGLAAADHRLDYLREGQRLELTAARASAALIGSSEFLRALGGSKSRIFAVKKPARLELVQRRCHMRHELDVPFHFRVFDRAAGLGRGKASPATTLNVSPGGLLFESETRVSVGDELELIMRITALDRLEIHGMVTRTREPAAADDGRPQLFETAVRFVNVTSVDQDRIYRFVLTEEHRRLEARQAASANATPDAQAARAALAISAHSVIRARPAGKSDRPYADPAVMAGPQPRPRPVTAEDLADPLSAVLGIVTADGSAAARLWFDELETGTRIRVLSELQAGMASESAEKARFRPLAAALGLVAA